MKNFLIFSLAENEKHDLLDLLSLVSVSDRGSKCHATKIYCTSENSRKTSCSYQKCFQGHTKYQICCGRMTIYPPHRCVMKIDGPPAHWEDFIICPHTLQRNGTECWCVRLATDHYHTSHRAQQPKGKLWDRKMGGEGFKCNKIVKYSQIFFFFMEFVHLKWF